LTLGPPLSLRRGQVEGNLAQRKSKHGLGEAKDDPDAQKGRHPIMEKYAYNRKTHADGGCHDEQGGIITVPVMGRKHVENES